MMLAREEIDAALERVNYYPGWTFTTKLNPYEGLVLRIDARVRNSYRPDEMTDLDIVTYIPPVETVAEFFRWLDYRLVRIASHEHREFFRVDGEVWSDPHGETVLT